MALSFTPEDQLWLKATVREALSEGFAAVGMGYDDTESQRALQADQQWVRTSRLSDEDRTRNIRRSVWGGLALLAAAAVLYLAVHLHDFSTFLASIAGAKPEK